MRSAMTERDRALYFDQSGLCVALCKKGVGRSTFFEWVYYFD